MRGFPSSSPLLPPNSIVPGWGHFSPILPTQDHTCTLEWFLFVIECTSGRLADVDRPARPSSLRSAASLKRPFVKSTLKAVPSGKAFIHHFCQLLCHKIRLTQIDTQSAEIVETNSLGDNLHFAWR